MRCKGTTQKGTNCKKNADADGYCNAHQSQIPVVETYDCARCGPEKQTTYLFRAWSNPKEQTPLCKSCAFALHSMVLGFLGVDGIDDKLLRFRETVLSQS